MRKLILLILCFSLFSCGDKLIESERDVITYTINHDSILQQIDNKKRLEGLKMDSISRLAKEITRLNTMKEVNMLNHFEKVKDSLVHELEIEHEIVHQLQELPRDSIIFDTIYEYITVYDTVKIYDTVTVKYSKFNKKRVKK